MNVLAVTILVSSCLAAIFVVCFAIEQSARFHPWASSLIRAGLLGDGVASNPVILAELCVGDDHPETVAERLEQLGVVLLDLPARTSQRCAQTFAGFLENRRKQTAPAIPKIPLPDFFIGAHARSHPRGLSKNYQTSQKSGKCRPCEGPAKNH